MVKSKTSIFKRIAEIEVFEHARSTGGGDALWGCENQKVLSWFFSSPKSNIKILAL